MIIRCYDNNTNIIDTSNYQDCKRDTCYFCKHNDTLNDTIYNDKIISVCYLCNIVINNKKEYVNMCLLGYSETLTQKQIIKKTREYYNENGSIPYPEYLDPNVKMVNLPVYIFSQFDNTKQFENFCIFFTSHVQDYMENKMDIAFKVCKKKDPIMKYYNFKDYNFTDEELLIVEKEKDNIRNKIFSPMKHKEEILNERYLGIIS